MFSAIPCQEQIEVKRSNICWISIHFYSIRFRSLIFYLLYIMDVIYWYKRKSWTFMSSNCCLQKHEGTKPENSYFQFFVIMSLWSKIVLKYYFLSSIWAYSVKVWSPLQILVKNVSSSKLKFLFFLFIFFISHIFGKLLTSSFFFSEWFFQFPILHYISFS